MDEDDDDIGLAADGGLAHNVEGLFGILAGAS